MEILLGKLIEIKQFYFQRLRIFERSSSNCLSRNFVIVPTQAMEKF